MTDAPSVVSLEDVRARFLEAELRLEEASKAVSAIEAAAASLGSTRESLAAAGGEVAGLASRFGEVAEALTANAAGLREGVDAIRLGDPAAIKRQIEELDAAFTALQSVMGERLEAVEAGVVAAGDGIKAVSAELEAAEVVRREGETRRLAAERRTMVLGVLALAGVVVVALLQVLVK